jgi:hypothetical protein
MQGVFGRDAIQLTESIRYDRVRGRADKLLAAISSPRGSIIGQEPESRSGLHPH